MDAMQKFIVVGLGIFLSLAPRHSEATEILECIAKLTDLPYLQDGKSKVFISDSTSITGYLEIPKYRKVEDLPPVFTELVGVNGWEIPIRLVLFGEINMSELEISIEKSVDSMNKLYNHMIGNWSNITIVYVGTESISPKLLSIVGEAAITLKYEYLDINSTESLTKAGC